MYFKNDKMEIMFYLLEMDGKLQTKKLKINSSHFNKKEIANKWYNNLKGILNGDTDYKEETERALNKLDELYFQMI